MRQHHLTTQNDYRSKYDWADYGHPSIVPSEDETGIAPSTVVAYLESGGNSGAEVELLADIVCLKDWLDDLTPHVVARARQSGHSWAQIARALGVTKQAVHKQYAATVGDLAFAEAGTPDD